MAKSCPCDLPEEFKSMSKDYRKLMATGDHRILKKLLCGGFPPNVVHPDTGVTLLHAFAGSSNRKAVNVLLERDDIDYLVRDRNGYLASEVAAIFSGDPEIVTKIWEKSKAQAERQGVRFTSRPAVIKTTQTVTPQSHPYDLPGEFNAMTDDYWKVVKGGDYNSLRKLLDDGYPPNLVHPFTEQTLLHSLAGTRSRPALKVLLERDDIDYLVRDRKGRLASECAFRFGGDHKLAQMLSEKEKEQAEREGVKLTRRPAPQP